jgi:hypothetical protein
LKQVALLLSKGNQFSYAARPVASTTSRVQVPRHVVRLVMRLVTPLVVDYFDYAAHPVASTRRAACRVTHRRLLRLAQARHRLLRLRRASGCLGTSRGSSRVSSSTTSTTPHVRLLRHVARHVDYFASRRLIVDYFTYAAHQVASTRRAACRVTHRRPLRLTHARCQLLRLRRTSGCLGTSRGSSCGSSSTTSPRAGSSSTTSPMPRVRLLRHVARLVA